VQPLDRSALYVLLGGLVAAVFVADLFTPLGVAVWILYVVPLVLTLLGRDSRVPLIGAGLCTVLMTFTVLTDAPGAALPIAYSNRAFGVLTVWVVGLLARNLIDNRNRLASAHWIRSTETELLQQTQGDLSVAEIGDRALALLAATVSAPVSALYVNEANHLRLRSSRGVRPGADIPEGFAPGEGLVGLAARSHEVSVIADVPESFLPIRSGLTAEIPRHLLVAPLVVDGDTQGILELGLSTRPDQRVFDLLQRVGHGLGVAVRTALLRDQLRQLLEETQRQAEQLQVHHEELQVSNENLAAHSRALANSQSRLEEQQAELEATNAQLEVQTASLEQRGRDLVAARLNAERASQYKSEFLANISHELRTPLNSTLILAKLLAQNKDGRLSAEQVQFAETIHASGNTLLTLINDILDLSKIEAGAVEIRPDQVALRPLAESLQAIFLPIARERRLEFTLDVVANTPPWITTDPQRLQQILTNLLANAFKFTEQGGVVLRIAPGSPHGVRFEVRDTGIGIPEEQQASIFDAFRQADGSTQRRYGGTGLGLSISLELARLLGGELRVSSQVGIGSTFSLTIPVAVHEAAGRGTAARVAPATAVPPRLDGAPRPASHSSTALGATVADDRDHRQRPGRLILVVEDDSSFAAILCDVVHELEFDCVIASNNDEGMALARELTPSGILLDIGLPDGSGLTFLDRIKRNPDTRHIPVHVISVDDYTQTALELGAVGYALKPVPRDELVLAIKKLESRLQQRMRRVLVVEDDPALRASLGHLLESDGVAIHSVGKAHDALEQLAAERFDCVVLDLNLPDASGYDVLESMSAREQYSFPPVVVYTGQTLSPEDEERLRRYSRSVVVKGARSPERLLDEVTLFLHQVESRLPPDARRLLRVARELDDCFAGRTILVVEDDVRNIFALTSVFEPRGAHVVIARNGREGIERARASRPDLVLMDIMMPEMDGLTAIRELRQHDGTRTVPIIALTAKASRADYEQCIAAGANDYLAKPLEVETLVSLSRVWISR
jgi:CheY-like chemotaxis protein/signal transduction histidine kinase